MLDRAKARMTHENKLWYWLVDWCATPIRRYDNLMGFYLLHRLEWISSEDETMRKQQEKPKYGFFCVFRRG